MTISKPVFLLTTSEAYSLLKMNKNDLQIQWHPGVSSLFYLRKTSYMASENRGHNEIAKWKTVPCYKPKSFFCLARSLKLSQVPWIWHPLNKKGTNLIAPSLGLQRLDVKLDETAYSAARGQEWKNSAVSALWDTTLSLHSLLPCKGLFQNDGSNLYRCCHIMCYRYKSKFKKKNGERVLPPKHLFARWFK